MQLLVIGGTYFVGRALVEGAVDRGHDVTVFHRGPAEPEGFPPVEHLHGDRDGGLDALRDRTWDAAIDTCGYVPRVVRDSARLLADAVRAYAFISTLSVYPDDTPPGCNEETPTSQPPFPDTEEITAESYGPLKAMQAATASGAELLRLPLVGTIEEGKEADLVLFDGNPAEAIEHVVSPLMVLKAGDVVAGSIE